MANLDLTNLELRALDLMIAAKQANVPLDDVVGDIEAVGDVVEGVGDVAEAIGVEFCVSRASRVSTRS